MKIAIVVDPHFSVPPKKYGGSERSVAYLIEGLIQLGHTVTLFGPGNSNVSCEVISCTPRNIDMGWDKTLEKEVLHAIDINVEHIIHLQDRFDVISWHGKIHKDMDKLHVPILLTLRNPLSKLLVQEVTTLVKESPYISINALSQKYMQVHKGVPFRTYIYNGLPTNIFPFNKKPKEYISFIGRFSEDKQPHVAIGTALQMKKKIVIGARLDRFGKAYFDKYCKRYMNNPFVDFRGEVNDKEKIKIFKNAQVNLHPIKFHEPFGLSVVEAGLCGTPTIAFDKGSMRELIHDGISGYVVKNLQELITIYPKAAALNRKKVRQHFLQFNHLRMASEYIKTFEEIIVEH